MPKWLADLPSSILTNIVAAVAISAAVALWTMTKVYASRTDLGLPVAISAGFVIFTLSVIAFNQLRLFDESVQKKKPKYRSPSDIEKQIIDWLLLANFSVQNDPDPEFDFRIGARDSTGLSTAIFKRKNSPFVIVAAKLEIDRNHRSIIKTAAPLFRLDVRLPLYQLGVQCEFEADDYDVKSITVSDPILFDESIDQLTFLRTNLLVRRGAALVLTMVQRIAEKESKSL